MPEFASSYSQSEGRPMDVFYNLWGIVCKRTQQSKFGEWFKVPKVYRSKEEEKTDIARRQLSLILDSPDRRRQQ